MKIPVKKIVEKERVVEKIEKVPKIKLVPKIVYSVQEVPKVEISYVNVEVSLWIEVAALESLRRRIKERISWSQAQADMVNLVEFFFLSVLFSMCVCD